MSLLSALGLGKKVRYAMVALGDITQEAMLPGVAHTGNSVVTAFVTGDPEKARKVAERYDVPNTDHFGGELKYFSDCILGGVDPEPDGEEGYADVRVLEGVLRALESGTAQTLEPFTRSRRIDTAAQRQTLPAQKSPGLVNSRRSTRC